jgi:uncharacterized protein (DUF362 family)
MTRREFGQRLGVLAAGVAVGGAAVAAEQGKAPDLVVVTGGKGLSKLDASYQRMLKATDRLGGLKQFVAGKDVLIKVNAIDKTTGDASTSIDAMQALVKLCKEQQAGSVTVISHDWGFDSPYRDGRTFRQGIKQAGAKLIHMKEEPEPYKPIEVNDGGWGTIRVAPAILQPNTVLINLPRLKTHPSTCFTCCVKNQMGLTCYMRAFHSAGDTPEVEKWPALPEKIAAAYQHIFRSIFKLHIVDAQEPTFGWDGPPPERMRTFEALTTIVSTDALAADVYAAGLMHELEPKLFVEPLSDWTKGDALYAKNNLTGGNYLLACAKRKLGETDLGKLKIEKLTV